jgi:equilibrative nucleoside transporter 1/2/3
LGQWIYVNTSSLGLEAVHTDCQYFKASALTSRCTIMSPPLSPKALYHAIPQALADESDEATLHPDSEEQEQDELAALDPPQALVDPRISWIYFLLGCSVLLPWNGMYSLWVILIYSVFTISLVMITAIPFFLSRLANSPLKSTFSSYLSTSFTAAGFVFLAHATAVSRRVSRSVINPSVF